VPPDASGAFQLAEVVDLETLERRYLGWARLQPGNDLPALAGRLGISQRTLYRKLQTKG
jgi:DNA-binding NtrC family response regulator